MTSNTVQSVCGEVDDESGVKEERGGFMRWRRRSGVGIVIYRLPRRKKFRE